MNSQKSLRKPGKFYGVGILIEARDGLLSDQIAYPNLPGQPGLAQRPHSAAIVAEQPQLLMLADSFSARRANHRLS